MRLLRVLCMMILLALASSMIGAQSVDKAQSFIAYVAVRGEEKNEEIFITSLSGKLTYNLTNKRSREWHPTWSSDGARLAFTSDRDENPEIYVMDANGQNQTRLTQSPATDVSPAWSPTVDEITFISDRDGGFDVYILTVSTREVRRITTDGQPKSDPDWSPDGTQIIYWRQVGNEAHLVAINPTDGVETVWIGSGQNLWPAWSPDGRQIAYHTPGADGTATLRLLTLDDGQSVALTDGASADTRAAWSPDGAFILFTSTRDGNMNLYIMNRDGSQQRRFTDSIEDENSPAWQPRPVALDFSGTAVGLSASVVTSAIDPGLQTELGEATSRVFAPELATLDDVIIVRVELSFPEQLVGTPEPTPDIPLRDKRAITAYAFMGARLTGSSLSKFEVIPSDIDYVLQLDPTKTNHWEWLLLPKDAQALGRSFLAVELYKPEQASDGTIIREVLETIPLRLEVVTREPETPSQYVRKTAMPEPTLGITVQYSTDEYLAVMFRESLNVSEMRMPFYPDTFSLLDDFPVIRTLSNQVEAGMCLYYVKDRATPTLPRSCQNQDALKFELSPTDLFWFKEQAGGLIDLVITLGELSLICPRDLASQGCEF